MNTTYPSVVVGPDPGGFEAEHIARWLSMSNTERKYIPDYLIG
jgi:hypothetical protein